MKPLACSLAAVIVLAATPAFAQSALSVPVPQAPQPAATFLEGAKVAYLDLERVASLSNEGKAATARLEELRTRKGAEIAERNKQVESLQARLAQTESVLSSDARTQLQRQFDRAQVDFQRFTQDAQAEVHSAQQQMLRTFMEHLFPVIGQVATEKNLWAVFTADSGLVWHHPAIDISDEVAKRLDTANAPR